MAKQSGIWITAVLLAIGAPRTKKNKKFMWGWWTAEGGNNGPYNNIHPSAKYNWLCTMRKVIGSTTYNSHGVQNYPMWIIGVRATVKTLKMDRYKDVRAALKSGNPFTDPPVDGLSIWNTGRPAKNNTEGSRYAERVIKLGLQWKL